MLNGPCHHGVEVYYSKEATSEYSTNRECHGKPYNEDVECSFSKQTKSVERDRNYLDIPVATFWEKICLPFLPTPGRRSTSSNPVISFYIVPFQAVIAIYFQFVAVSGRLVLFLSGKKISSELFYHPARRRRRIISSSHVVICCAD